MINDNNPSDFVRLKLKQPEKVPKFLLFDFKSANPSVTIQTPLTSDIGTYNIQLLLECNDPFEPDSKLTSTAV